MRRTAGSTNSAGGSLYKLRVIACFARLLLLCQLLLVEVADDSGNVSASLVIRRHPSVLRHAPWPGVVGGECFDQVEVIFLEQFTKVARAAIDVCLWVESVIYAEV